MDSRSLRKQRLLSSLTMAIEKMGKRPDEEGKDSGIHFGLVCVSENRSAQRFDTDTVIPDF
jgi:hypothetical protein